MSIWSDFFNSMVCQRCGIPGGFYADHDEVNDCLFAAGIEIGKQHQEIELLKDRLENLKEELKQRTSKRKIGKLR